MSQREVKYTEITCDVCGVIGVPYNDAFVRGASLRGDAWDCRGGQLFWKPTLDLCSGCYAAHLARILKPKRVD